MKKVTDAKIALGIRGAAKQPNNDARLVFVEREFGAMRRATANSALESALGDLQSYFSATDQAELGESRLFSLLDRLRSQSLTRSAAALWDGSLEKLKKLPLQQWLPVAPNAACIEKIRKTVALPKRTLVTELGQNLDQVYATAGLDWLLLNSDPKEAHRAVEMVLRMPARPGYLMSNRDLLGLFLAKDPRGRKLLLVLGTIADDERQLSDLLSTSSKNVLKNVPILARNENLPFSLAKVIRVLFSSPQVPMPSAVRQRCGELAILGGQILTNNKKSLQGETALREIYLLGNEMRLETLTSKSAESLWILEPIDSSDQLERENLTVEGAKQWAMVYQRAVIDGQALGYLETLAFNLGLREIARIGDEVSFLPKQHEDVDGGLLPGDSVAVLTSGWKMGDLAVVRAKVRRKTG